MAVYEPDLDRIVLRVVYDGPGRAGKTTNIEQLARLFGGESPDLQLLAADNGHTTFFDWLSFDGGMIDGHRLLIQIVGVPGAKRFEHRRAHILRGADAVVLVCDSAPNTIESARETLDSQREHLGKRGATIPLIVQANKQDLTHALQAHEVGAALGLPYEVPVIGAEATAGIGTRETAVHAIRAAVRLVKRRTAKPGIRSIVGAAGTLAALRTALESAAVGDEQPEDTSPLDLVAAATAASPNRRVFRPTAIDEPHLVYVHTDSAAVQAAKLRVGEPGDEDLAIPGPPRAGNRNRDDDKPIDPNETLPSHPIINLDDPDPPPSRARKGARRRDGEPTETRPTRARKTQTTETSKPAQTTSSGTRKLPPRRRTEAGVSSRPPSVPVPAAAPLRPPSVPVPAAPPAPPFPIPRTPSGAITIASDHPPSGAIPIVPDIPTPPGAAPPIAAPIIPDRPPSAVVTIVPGALPTHRDVPLAQGDRPPSGVLPVAHNIPTAQDDRPPSAPVPKFLPPITRLPEPAPTPPPPAPPLGIVDELSPGPGNLSVWTAPPPPQPPLPDLPPGHVWPIPGGRDVLRALAAANAPRIALPSEGDLAHFTAGPFRLSAMPFPDEAAALSALFIRVRQWLPVRPLLPGLAFAVDNDASGTATLWRVAPQLAALGEHLLELAPSPRVRLLDTFARTIGLALTLCHDKHVVLDLHPDAYAVEYGRIVYLRDDVIRSDYFGDVGDALLALPALLVDDPALDVYIDALARELAAFIELERDDVGLIAALERSEPQHPQVLDARTRLLAALEPRR